MNDINVSTVYCILNIPTGKKYIGSTTRFGSRKRQHKYELRRGIHPSKSMQEDWSIYGEDSFQFFELEKVYTFDRDELFAREQHWMDLYLPEYNGNPLAGNWFHESAYSPEAKAKHSEKIRGRKQSPEWVKRRMDTMKRNGKQKLKVVTPEQKKHLSEINTGERNPNWGLKRTPEQLENLSKGRANKKYIYLSPAGNEIEIVNMQKNGLSMTGISTSVLRKLRNGKIKQSRGWTFLREEFLK